MESLNTKHLLEESGIKFVWQRIKFDDINPRQDKFTQNRGEMNEEMISKYAEASRLTLEEGYPLSDKWASIVVKPEREGDYTFTINEGNHRYRAWQKVRKLWESKMRDERFLKRLRTPLPSAEGPPCLVPEDIDEYLSIDAYVIDKDTPPENLDEFCTQVNQKHGETNDTAIMIGRAYDRWVRASKSGASVTITVRDIAARIGVDKRRLQTFVETKEMVKRLHNRAIRSDGKKVTIAELETIAAQMNSGQQNAKGGTAAAINRLLRLEPLNQPENPNYDKNSEQVNRILGLLVYSYQNGLVLVNLTNSVKKLKDSAGKGDLAFSKALENYEQELNKHEQQKKGGILQHPPSKYDGKVNKLNNVPGLIKEIAKDLDAAKFNPRQVRDIKEISARVEDAHKTLMKASNTSSTLVKATEILQRKVRYG